MITRLLPDKITYDGTQLGSAFLTAAIGPEDDAAVAFFGPADVPTENLVDNEDRLAGGIIKSKRMAHFLVRLKGRDLDYAVAFQRLIVACILDLLMLASPGDWTRAGDDIYLDNASGKFKLTVSIATTGATGDAFIHVGVNVIASGAPVPAIGLRDMCLNENMFATDVLAAIETEERGIAHAVAKVRTVE
jgi:hypothetical protein